MAFCFLGGPATAPAEQPVDIKTTDEPVDTTPQNNDAPQMVLVVPNAPSIVTK
jgi:hypothetical protein